MLPNTVAETAAVQRFELLQYAPYYSLVWTLRDYADRLSLATQSVQGLGRLTGSVAKIMRKLASFLKVGTSFWPGVTSPACRLTCRLVRST
jgi:hypothetical protein